MRDVDRALATLTIKRPELVRGVVRLAIKKPSARTLKWAERILNLAAADTSGIVSLALEIGAAGLESRETLFPVIAHRLQAAQPDIGEIESAVQRCSQRGPAGNAVLSQVIEPLIYERLQAAQDDDQWRRASIALVRAATPQGQLPRVIRQLAGNERSRVTDEVIESWRTVADELQVADELDAVLEESGLSASLIVAPPIIEQHDDETDFRETPSVIRLRTRRGKGVRGGLRTGRAGDRGQAYLRQLRSFWH